MSGAAPGQLERALSELTIGVQEAREWRDRQVRDGGGHETIQQIRIPISGLAAGGFGATIVKVGFLLPFLWMPMQRSVPFATPHFSHGFEFTTGPGGVLGEEEQVMIDIALAGWQYSSQLDVIGAQVRVGAIAPNYTGTTGIPFNGEAHLTFQGYAAEQEDEGGTTT